MTDENEEPYRPRADEPFTPPQGVADTPLVNHLGVYLTSMEIRTAQEYLEQVAQVGKAITDESWSSYVKRKAAEMAKERLAAESAGPPSWARIDPVKALEESRSRVEPTVGQFSGEYPAGVFYEGSINSVIGESESGKSWLALYVVSQELKAGNGVLYVDYEDSAGPVYRRLRLLGVPEDILLGDLFRYHQPNGPLTDQEMRSFEESASLGGRLAVFDGMTEGMGLEGWEPRNEVEVAMWHGKVTKDLAHTGWAVVVLDHMPHEQQRAIGSQHKKAAISGVSYMVKSSSPICAGGEGWLHLNVLKDRHASIRAEAVPDGATQLRGYLKVDFSHSLTDADAALLPAKRSVERDQGYDETPNMDIVRALVAFVTANPECTTSEIRLGVKGKTTTINAVLDWCKRGQYVREQRQGRKVVHVPGEELPCSQPRSGSDLQEW